ncbi:MAG: transcription antitermination factor NusB [Gemmataceae bacterium]|nr:transcription antitermination factor NusB [Gemmataceae bacterium]
MEPTAKPSQLRRRSRAREVAFQLLFQHEANPGVGRPHLERFATERLGDEALEQFALALYDGARPAKRWIDELLAAAATNWRVARMAATDRNVLRLGAYELLHPSPDTPPAIIISEAVELAKRFGGAESGAFVNGVLDRVRKDADR